MLGRIDAAIGSHRHDLQLQEQLQQRPAAVAKARKLVDRGIQREVRLLASIERGNRLLPLLTLQVQHAEDPLDCGDLVAADDAVGLAERAHDGKRRVEQVLLRDPQVADDVAFEGKARDITGRPAHQDTRPAAKERANQGACEEEEHRPSLAMLRPLD